MNLGQGRRGAAVAAATLLLAACNADSQGQVADGSAQADTVTVVAVDYGYQGLPGTLAAGTTVVLDNASEGEVHEILAMRLPDAEQRPANELLQLPPEELEGLLEMRGVALAPPGEDSTDGPTPPLVLEQPGRYLFMCVIPTAAPPDEVMAAVAAFIEAGAPEGSAPAYPETGPPHFVNGMYADVTVE